MLLCDPTLPPLLPRYRDIQECYRTLAMYNIAVPQEEVEMAAGIEEKWKNVFTQSRQVDKSLISVKKKFTLVRVTVGGVML